MPWPLEPDVIHKFARDLDLIIVVEEKRALIEIPDQGNALQHRPAPRRHRQEATRTAPRCSRKKAPSTPIQVAIALGERLIRRELGGEAVADACQPN